MSRIVTKIEDGMVDRDEGHMTWHLSEALGPWGIAASVLVNISCLTGNLTSLTCDLLIKCSERWAREAGGGDLV